MSNKKDRVHLDRQEMRVFLVRQGLTQKAFAEKHGINEHTFKTWMNGNTQMPEIDRKIRRILNHYDYPIDLIIDPGLRLQIEGATA